MSELKVLLYPDPILSCPANPVEKITRAEKTLSENMIETMYRARGLGLAAPQVGVSVRIVVLDSNPADWGKKPTVLINPVIIEQSGEITWEEGCLSLPEFRAEIKRSAEVKVRAQTPGGEEIEITGHNLLAVILQHEIDHLDGKLILDRVGRLKKNFYLRKIKKLKRI